MTVSQKQRDDLRAGIPDILDPNLDSDWAKKIIERAKRRDMELPCPDKIPVPRMVMD